ncbi:MAG: RsmB/NOP family class I SAM-dependent RNA methyltransferase [Clostridia bacterium]|nr:RsmB/NOP family class I SAM-dependent RNA methyltransferase [Clostridia bacterium]
MEVAPYLMERLLAQYGPETASEIICGFEVPRCTTLRANRLKGGREETEEALTAAGLTFRRAEWFEDAFVLPAGLEKELSALPFYQGGKIYLQSLSSMLPPLLLEAQAGENILDMAAAPGGKTTEIASLTDGKAMITACERSLPRLERMKANLARQGCTRVTTLNMDARQLDDFFSFDRVLLDAPCSGSGTVTKDSRGRFEPALLKKTAALQRAMLDKALRLVRPGGIVVYSTCSILKEENEDTVTSALKSGRCELLPVDEERYAAVPRLPCAIPGALLVRPTAEYEGFFAAVLRRKN